MMSFDNYIYRYIDVEFWRAPSRRLYIVQTAEYEDLTRSLRSKRKAKFCSSAAAGEDSAASDTLKKASIL